VKATALLVPLGPSTVTRTEPVPGGTVAVITASATTVKAALVAPNFTAVAPVKPEPTIWTELPGDAVEGEMTIIVGIVLASLSDPKAEVHARRGRPDGSKSPAGEHGWSSPPGLAR
jgi:hypothetical protein